MSDAPSPQTLITELQASAHLMLLEAGVYCVHHSPGSLAPDPKTGLPGARLSVPPGQPAERVTIIGFRDDGWLGTLDAAALIRIPQGSAHVLMTIYQDKNSHRAAPKLQVTRLLESSAPLASKPPVNTPANTPVNSKSHSVAAAHPANAVTNPEVATHIQGRGDVLGRLGDWTGERGSGRWIEGFALSPRQTEVTSPDIEYQAVLGRGWLSPWAEGGQFCGSRGMSLPILGLRVRLKGKAAQTHTLQVSATFTDGSASGPVLAGEPCESKSMAPLEAFCVTVMPQALAALPKASPAKTAAKRPAKVAAQRKLLEPATSPPSSRSSRRQGPKPAERASPSRA